MLGGLGGALRLDRRAVWGRGRCIVPVLASSIGLGGATQSRAATGPPVEPPGWRAPLGCISEAEFQSRLPPTPSDPRGSEVAFEFVVERVHEDEWKLVVSEDGRRTHELLGNSCAELSDAALLLFRLALGTGDAGTESLPADASAQGERGADGGEDASKTGAEEKQQEDEPEQDADGEDLPPLQGQSVRRVVPAGGSSPWRWAAALSAGGAVNILPGFHLISHLQVGLRRQAMSADVGVSGRPRAPTAGDVGSASASTFDYWAGRLDACWVPDLRRTEFPLCGAGEVGRIRGRHTEGTEDFTDQQWLVMLVVSSGVRVPFGQQFFGVVRAELDVLPVYPTFAIENGPTLCCNAVGASLMLGGEWRLPARTRPQRAAAISRSTDSSRGGHPLNRGF